MNERRTFFARLASATAAFWASGQAVAQQHDHHAAAAPAALAPVKPVAKGKTLAAKVDPHAAHRLPAENLPVQMPDLPKLPFKMVDGVKEFRLIAEVVETELMPGRPMTAWGFNGSIPGPTIEVNQGDRVRVIVENRLPEMTAMHWHGFEVPMEMDGSVGLGQDPIPPGGSFTYEWELNQHGTFFYHSHFAMQEMMGMIGMFIMHPKVPYEPRVDRDFGLVLQEWALLPNNNVPNTLSMEFNWLSLNGKAGPDCTPMIVKQGERVRIRMFNIGMDHHPIHLHGTQFVMTGTEGGRVPQHQWHDINTIIVGVAQARNIEFEAKYLGDWMLHCHLPHHMMNQMASMVGPISHGGHGMHTGGSMTDGMGMLKKGDALSEEFGPVLGRGLGLSADRDRATSNLVSNDAAQHQGHEGHSMVKPGDPMEMYPKDDPEKKKVAGYPQDMWMVMDEIIPPKPENLGLRKGWTGSMMGMMTLVRVVTPEMYDQIMELKKTQPAKSAKPAAAPAHQHEHGK
ncbi:MAG: multicopper oxidase domain-containing protein [Bryobacteraceae bacterium]|nr:multicopper oxidase domain-containing protein [Bryobacteraceae bacterium]